jgi:hypothetical protein
MAVFSGSGHYFLIGLLAVMAGSCTTELDEPRESAVPETFYATIDDNTGHEATRTFTDESLLVRWSKEDHISVFNGNTAATEYAFAGEDGDLEGEFEILHLELYVQGTR